MDIRDYIKPIRMRLRIKQQDLEKLLGVSNTTLSLWEHKHKELHLRNKRKLVQVFKELGVNLDEYKGN